MADEFIARNVDLHHVHAVAAAFAGDTAELDRPVGDQAEAFLIKMAHPFIAKARRGSDLGAAGQHPGAVDQPLVDGVARGDAQHRLGRGGLEDRGEAMAEQKPQVLRGQQHVPLGSDLAKLPVDVHAGE